jgi:hypothetical protein
MLAAMLRHVALNLLFVAAVKQLNRVLPQCSYSHLAKSYVTAAGAF